MFKRKKKEEFEAPIYEADDFMYAGYYEDFSAEEMYGDNGFESGSTSDLSYLIKSRQQKQSKSKKKRKDNIYYIDPANAEANLYSEYTEEQNTSRKGNRLKAILFLVAIYMGFVLLGALNTTYETTLDGQKKAQVINVALREKREVYYFLESEYDNLVRLLREIQELEAKTFGGSSDSMFELAAKYEGLLPHIDKRLPKIKAMEMPQEYKIIQTQMINIYKDDIALYLQNISKALSVGDEQALKNAVNWSQKTAVSFRQIQRNMSELALLVKLDNGKYTKADAYEYQGLKFSQ
jgi:hypothetical protein